MNKNPISTVEFIAKWMRFANNINVKHKKGEAFNILLKAGDRVYLETDISPEFEISDYVFFSNIINAFKKCINLAYTNDEVFDIAFMFLKYKDLGNNVKIRCVVD